MHITARGVFCLLAGFAPNPKPLAVTMASARIKRSWSAQIVYR
jgi:hypothetical protein